MVPHRDSESPFSVSLVGPVARPGPDPQVASPKAHAWRKAPSSLICLSLLSIVESRYNESTYNRGCRAP